MKHLATKKIFMISCGTVDISFAKISLNFFAGAKYEKISNAKEPEIIILTDLSKHFNQ